MRLIVGKEIKEVLSVALSWQCCNTERVSGTINRKIKRNGSIVLDVCWMKPLKRPDVKRGVEILLGTQQAI